jgi:SAM-dependent methyltransferase
VAGELTLPEQAAVWDRRAREASVEAELPDAPLCERLGGLKPKLRAALDIGCGSGRHLILLSALGWRATGLDWSAAALSRARQAVRSASLHADLVKADYRSLPFGPGSFHLAVATRALHHSHLDDFRRALGELKRVLAIGGRAVISVPSLANAPRSGGQWVEPGTFVPAEGVETGLPHHFFSEDELITLTAHFRRVELSVIEEPPGFLEPELAVPPGAALRRRNDWFWLDLTG